VPGAPLHGRREVLESDSPAVSLRPAQASVLSLDTTGACSLARVVLVRTIAWLSTLTSVTSNPLKCPDAILQSTPSCPGKVSHSSFH
jgi:hypothetical protein